MIAFTQNLRASAGAHQAMIQVGIARACIGRAQRETNRNCQQRCLRSLDPEREAFHGRPPFSAGSPGVDPEAVRAGTRSEAVDGLRLGTSATSVPNTSTTRPAQIHPTSGLRIALMIG